jgi:hypothetical protein
MAGSSAGEIKPTNVGSNILGGDTMTRFVKVLLINSIFLFSTAAAFEPIFDTRIDNPVGEYVASTIFDDFNDDGIDDIVCGGSFSSSYAKIFLGNGDGTFNFPPDSFYVGLRPYYMASGDFNNDGLADLVTVTQPYYWDINIMMNNGDGTFTYESMSGVTSSPVSTTDIDKDGYDDIIITSYGSICSAVISNGDGTFDYGDDIVHLVNDEIYGLNWIIHLVDINHDDDIDILKFGYEFVNLGEGGFYQLPVIATYVNNGDSTFQAPVLTYYGTQDDAFTSGILGHFNSDNDIDILFTDDSGVMGFMISNGNGSFTLGDSFEPAVPGRMSVGYFNDDNYADIFYFDPASGNIAVTLNNGGDGFSFSDPEYYSGRRNDNPTYITKLYSRDLNNDNLDEIITTNWEISVYKNRNNGSFPIDYSFDGMGLYEPSAREMDMLTADFDGDNYPDIMTLSADRIYLAYNDGTGHFGTPEFYHPGLEWFYGIFAGYFNDDNIMDFGVTGLGLRLFMGQAEGGFAGGANFIDIVGSFTGEDGVAAELNGDDETDYAIFNYGGVDLNLILSDGLGSYTKSGVALTDATNAPLESIIEADIDNDNDIDLVIGSRENVIYVLKNDGAGDFSNYDEIATSSMVFETAVADLNGDGFADIAAAQDHVGIYLNNQDGSFAPPVDYAEIWSHTMRAIEAVDMDNDGDLDLTGSVYSANRISVLLNRGDGTFICQFYAGAV